MPWLELSVHTRQREWRWLEPALEELGALSITLLDAGDEPILEPAPGETPLWRELTAIALFDAGTDRRGLVKALQELVYTLEDERLMFAELADADWTRAWKDQFRPMRFGSRLWIVPSNHDSDAIPADAIVVRLDPGLAFGSGTHPTTALCLEWLDAAAAAGELAGRSVLDYGCGSGVLAIAALRLGAADAFGVDRDPQALSASADNAARNEVAARLTLASDAGQMAGGADIVLANILAAALIELAPNLARAARPGAPLVLSGILTDQVDEVVAAYDGLATLTERCVREGWARVTLARSTG
jgi:ribosomal protein L11 methyltransferase